MKNDNFTKGNIASSLIKFAIPLMLALALQALYGAVDLWAVGKYAATSSASAVAVGSQTIQVFLSIITGLTIGVTVLISNAVGAKDDEQAGTVLAGQIKLFVIMSIAFTALLYIFAPQISTWMNAPEQAFDETVKYLRICSFGMIFIFAYNGISGVFRGVGNSKSPLVFVFIACLCNIILDVVFVKYFNMAASGAALATVISQGVSVIFSVIYMFKNPFTFRLKKRMFKGNKSVLSILRVGSPIAIQDFLTGTSFLIIASLVNSMGIIASTSIGIMNKMFVFIALIPMSMMSALATFVGQNMGAKQYGRVNKSLFIALAFSLFAGLTMFLATFFCGDILAALFTDDAEVIKACQGYMKYESFEYIMLSITFCLLGYFNGLKKTSFVMFQGLFATFAIRIPVSFYIASLENTSIALFGLAAPISAVSALIFSIIYLVYLKKTMFKNAIE